MRRLEVTASTMGQAKPANVTLGKPYRWRGIPGWMPGGMRYREDVPARPGTAGKAARHAQRQQRLDVFAAALRALGQDPATASAENVTEAGRQAGVRERTARTYRAELRGKTEGSAS